MSIDKNSTGLPGIDVCKRATKVNLWMIVALLGFPTLMAALALRASRDHDPAVAPPPAMVVKV